VGVQNKHITSELNKLNVHHQADSCTFKHNDHGGNDGLNLAMGSIGAAVQRYKE
jgi:hypothetical protein